MNSLEGYVPFAVFFDKLGRKDLQLAVPDVNHLYFVLDIKQFFRNRQGYPNVVTLLRLYFSPLTLEYRLMSKGYTSSSAPTSWNTSFCDSSSSVILTSTGWPKAVSTSASATISSVLLKSSLFTSVTVMAG